MFPWGMFVGLAGQAISGIASAANNKRTQSASDREYAERQAFNNAKANENPLARSDNQHLLGKYDRDARQQVENARGVANITGATPEYTLGVQKAVAEGRSDLMGKMSANASQRADYYSMMSEHARQQKYTEDQARKAERNQTYANLAANAANAAGAIIDSYGPARKAAAAGGAEANALHTPEITTDPSAEENKAGDEAQWNDMERYRKFHRTGGAVLIG